MKRIYHSISFALAVLFVLLISEGLLAASVNTDLRVSGQRATSEDFERIRGLSLQYLSGDLASKNADHSGSSFEAKSIEIDEEGLAHTRMQAKYGGIPIWGSEAIIHLNPDETLFAITDDLLTQPTVSTTPVFQPNDALEAAYNIAGCRNCLQEGTQPDLFIFKNQLAYRIQLNLENIGKPSMPVYFIDAGKGESLWDYDNLQGQSAVGSGPSLYSGTVSFTTFKIGTSFYMENLSRRIGTFNASTAVRFIDLDNIWNSSIQRAAIDAHWGAEKTLAYYQNVLGRNGINGSGGPTTIPSANGTTTLLPSKVHYGSAYNNAFWDGSSMTYGDGDGVSFSPLVSLDIVAHELTHGLTQFTAGLIYSGESGGLNEAVSDIFGAMVERSAKGQSANTWLIGEDAFTPGRAGDALRYMETPHIDGRSIDHYSAYTNGMDVHFSSGIANKEFTLLAVGGTHRRGGSMTGIGADKAAQIWYRALRSYMTSNTNFIGARTATFNAATALYGTGSNEAFSVLKSWCLVGVGSCPVRPQPRPTCGNGLLPNQSLLKGQMIRACNGIARLVFQNDGNVVLYSNTNQALWNTGTWNRPNASLFVMQGDGNLVLYQGSVPLWSSRTNGNSGALLVLQDDRNMVIYGTDGRALWETRTY